LQRCLESLHQQTVRDVEIVLVNNSRVPLRQLPVGKVPFRLLTPPSNLGFAAANNLAARRARGTWLVLLNNDAFPAPNWLEQLLVAAEQQRRYRFFASRLVQARRPAYLDGCGDVYHISGLAWRRYYNLPADRYGLEAEEVFGPCAAAAMYDREAFFQVGGFDEDYFAYHEDVDLAFRLRLAGYRCLYVPTAVVYHLGSASTGLQSDFAVYHGHRNLVWTFIKDMPSPLFQRYLPVHWLMTAVYLGYYLARGQGAVFFRARRDAWRAFSRFRQKRRQIQRQRQAPVAAIEALLSRHWLAPLRLGRWRNERNAP